MEHPDFLVWVICYPVFLSLYEAIRVRWGRKRVVQPQEQALADIVACVFYFVVAIMLW